MTCKNSKKKVFPFELCFFCRKDYYFSDKTLLISLIIYKFLKTQSAFLGNFKK